MSDNKITIPLTLTITNWNQDVANKLADFNNINLTGCKSIEEQLGLYLIGFILLFGINLFVLFRILKLTQKIWWN